MIDAEGTETAVTVAARVIADELTGRDLNVAGPEWDQTQLLKIENVQGALCEITISDSGAVILEYRQVHGQAGPTEVASMVMEFLCASSSTAAAVTSPGRETGLTLKGAVGLALRACGMRVRIGRLARDESVCDVYAEIEATNPARHDRGRVFVGDDGVIRWECKLSDSDRDVQGLQPTEIAAALASGLPGQRRP